jgi:hypothetical protein
MSKPRNLGKAGTDLWTQITKIYDLRPDETRILEDACREADIIADLESGRTGMPLLVTGSMGQDVINPMISELRQHRNTLSALLKALKLAEDTAESRSASARAAANARWNRRGA